MFTINENMKLGSGSFGTVFSGLFNGLPVAIKKIELCPGPDWFDSLGYIENEAKIQKKLKHENIVELFLSEQQDNNFYLVLELMDAGDLYDILYTNNTDLNSSECVTIAQNIADGLDYLHAQGFLHRDIKPENILFNTRGQAKIADFGSAIRGNDVQVSYFTGTRPYTAPEIALSMMRNASKYRYNKLTDSYALGITLLEMLRRKSPYDKNIEKLSWQEIADGNHDEIPIETAPILANVISSCLTNDPQYRIDAKGIKQLLLILRSDADASIPSTVNGSFHVIHFAANSGRFDIVKKLIERDPKLANVIDDHDFSPLDLAIKGDHTDCISILKAAGAVTNNNYLFFNDPKKQKKTPVTENYSISSPW